MSCISERFNYVQKENKRALVTFITAGDPDRETTEKVLDSMVENGADIVELGIPFSDPMADGPAIQAASQRALAGGMKLKTCMEIAANFKQKYPHIPLVFMGYYNPIFSMGDRTFCEAAQKAKVDGLIVVDMPPEENALLQDLCHQHSIDWVSLIAPTTPPARLKTIADKSRGFLYRVSIAGITGSKTPDPKILENEVMAMRAQTDLPIGIGFGINTPADVAAIAPYADAIVVGSALVRLVAESTSSDDASKKVGELVAKLAQATKL